MSSTLQYTLSLSDQMSQKLAKIGVSSDVALNKFSKLEQKSKNSKKVLDAMGKSVGSLEQKLDLLRSERDWIPKSNIQSVQRYNREIRSVEKEIQKLKTTGRSWKSQLMDSAHSIPGFHMLTNPIVAIGAGFAGTAKLGLDFDKGMAQINTTAQLSQKELKGLKNELLSIDPKLVKNYSDLPQAYESIISQTGDVKLSTDILKTSLKGAKGGFTDVGVVSSSLAQSLSLIGKENASASEVLDTFFAAKRVGAGEFQDFARYMPGLIASGDALGIKYKEVAGLFAFMTGKGQSAERSAVLMENAFSAMSKVDVRKNMAEAGINVFDESGSIRSMTSIFSELRSKMDGMSDESKSKFLANIGLTDKEARSAFMILTSDTKKLSASMKDVKNASGETDAALKNAKSGADNLSEIWSKLQKAGIKIGSALGKILVPVLEGVSYLLSATADTLSWLVDGFSEGNMVVIGLTTGVSALTIAMKWSAVSMKLQNTWLSILMIKEKLMLGLTKAKAIAMGIATGATYLWEAATIALNAAWAASPIGAIIVGVAALGAITYGVSKMIGQQSAAQKLHNQVEQKAIQKSAAKRSELDLMIDRLKNAKKGTKEYTDALNDLEAAYPGIIDQYNLQKGSLDDINKAHKDLIANIDAVARQEALKEMLTEEYKKEAEAKRKIKTGDKSWGDQMADALMPVVGSKIKQSYELKDSQESKAYLKKELLQANKDVQRTNNALKAGVVQDSSKGSDKIGNNSKGSEKMEKALVYDTEEKINERLKILGEQRSKEVIDSQKYKDLGKEIKRLEKKLGRHSGRSAGSKSNSAIASGGSKQTTINLNFKNIVERIAVSGSDFKDAKKNLEEQSADAIVRSLSMAVSTAG